MQKLGTIPCSQAVTKSHELFDAVWMEKNLMTGLPLPRLKKKKRPLFYLATNKSSRYIMLLGPKLTRNCFDSISLTASLSKIKYT